MVDTSFSCQPSAIESPGLPVCGHMASAAPDPMVSAAPNHIAPAATRTQAQFLVIIENELGGEISRQLAEQLVLAP